jgi:FkbM family methyltransferase
MKITNFGVAVVDGDTHLSKWIVEQGRLDIAEGFLNNFRRYIPNGGVVADIGACLGDHTASYSNFVGPSGAVHAFEPNPVALECLLHNMKAYKNVMVHGCALGASEGEVGCNRNDNLGMATIVAGSGIKITTLDSESSGWSRLDFVKIDAEGYEFDILSGAQSTLSRLRPVMLIEVNQTVLRKQGKSSDDIYRTLRRLDYTYKPCEPHLSLQMDMVDVLCLPK